MNALAAYANLREAGQPVMQTGEVARRLGMPESTATSLLGRLAHARLITRVHHGLWAITPVSALALPEHLTAPFPSYVSFETALFQHGMIEQIPPRVTVASLGKPRVVRTPLGTFVIRQIPPRLFGGFEDHDGARLATPEKALFDTIYRAAHQGWNATYFPEIELPNRFDGAELDHWIDRILSPKLRTMVTAILQEFNAPVAHEAPAWVSPDKARERARRAQATDLTLARARMGRQPG